MDVDGNYIPITAHEASLHTDVTIEFTLEYLQCPECHSTPYGIPTTEKT